MLMQPNKDVPLGNKNDAPRVPRPELSQAIRNDNSSDDYYSLFEN
jgi:hypothetical protein